MYTTISGTCTALNFVATSDINLKTNIEPLYDSLSKVTNLNGYNYIFKSDLEQKMQSGLIAQEVEEVIPEVITFIDNEKTYKGVDYNGVIPYLIESIKEQQRQIDELKQLVEKLIKK